MQLPFIAHIMAGREYTLVPIMVGSTSYDMEQYYGKVLSKYFDEEGTVFVISSDFCHWGSRFNYTYYDKSKGLLLISCFHSLLFSLLSLSFLSLALLSLYLPSSVSSPFPLSLFLFFLSHPF